MHGACIEVSCFFVHTVDYQVGGGMMIMSGKAWNRRIVGQLLLLLLLGRCTLTVSKFT